MNGVKFLLKWEICTVLIFHFCKVVGWEKEFRYFTAKFPVQLHVKDRLG